MSKNCDHSKAFKTEALCMNSLRKREHFVAYTVKLGAVLKCSGLIHTWVCYLLNLVFTLDPVLLTDTD